MAHSNWYYIFNNDVYALDRLIMKTKRTKKYIPKPVSAPMLVMRKTNETTIESAERIAVTALYSGFATQSHVETISDMISLLMIAGGTDKRRQYANDYATNVAHPVFETINARHDKTGKYGVTSEELQVLLELIEFNKVFWNRQPTTLFAMASRELRAFWEDKFAGRIAA
jgi:hypothetical protein